ncbi:MAG: SPOR domain-containing protein [Sedimenticola sp.]
MKVNEGLKKRLVGATVLVSLVVIFVPMLLENEPMVSGGITESNIPPRPDTDFTSRVLPLESENLAMPPATAVPSVGVVTAAPLGQPAATPPAAVPKVIPLVAQVAEKPQPAPQPQPQPQPTPPVEQRVGLSAWVVQVGSFSKRDNAARVETQLKSEKFPAFIEQISIDGNDFFRVKVGPEIDRELAEELLKRVNKRLVSLKLKGSLTHYQ